MAPKTILFTGVSSGFGRLTVPLLLDRGHRVLAGIRGGRERLVSVYGDEHADALEDGRLAAIDLHMERPDSVAAARARIDEAYDGRLDVLVNNAGYGLLAPVEEVSEEALRRQMEVNFFGPTMLAKSMLDPLRAARGRVLNVTSIAGLVSFPYYGVYSASKFALQAVSQALRAELAPFGVQVGVIAPGGYRTRFTDTALSEGRVTVVEGSLYERSSAAFNRFIADASMKGAGDPVVVAKAIARLCDSRRVPMRTLCGPDAHGLSFALRVLPNALLRWLIELTFRKVVFRP